MSTSFFPVSILGRVYLFLFFFFLLPRVSFARKEETRVYKRTVIHDFPPFFPFFFFFFPQQVPCYFLAFASFFSIHSFSPLRLFFFLQRSFFKRKLRSRRRKTFYIRRVRINSRCAGEKSCSFTLNEQLMFYKSYLKKLFLSEKIFYFPRKGKHYRN